ncbi:MAG: flagellar hook-length control protein FliK, partial [Desulfobacterales bacterium]|nr:flagellar hook-length control protein FliK [Desulfobacterales bacterium]
KSAVEQDRTEKNTEKNSFIPVKNGGKNDIGNPLKHLGLKGEAKAVIGKNAASVFRDGGQKQTGAGKAEVGACPPSVWRGRSLPAVSLAGSELARRQSGGVGGGRAEMADAPGLLKFSLKNAVVVKGKSAVEQDSTGKNDIGNPLKPLGLKGKEAIEILHRGTSPPERPSDRDFSAGAYHHTSFHSGGSSSAINESVNSYDIEPRALINQIANSIKKPGRVKITLNPPRLGTLDVDVLVRDNKVHVILQTENNDVRQILQSNVESLKSSLRNQGLVADTINVSVQEKPDSANYGPNHGPGQSETLFREGRNREGNEEDHGGEQDSLNHDPSSFKEENPSVRSDGRVSLFA